MWKNDLLWYQDCLYFCKNSQLKHNIVFELHTYPIGGHSGFLKTYDRIKKDFFWEGLKNNVQNFVVECVTTRRTPCIGGFYGTFPKNFSLLSL
jgi:hypothetical protein